MRNIKFRAWDTLGKLMYDDTFAITESGEAIVIEQNSIWDNPDYIFAKNLVLMQYTGLKDKNGVEIYEGDIVSTYMGSLLRCDYNELDGSYIFTPIPIPEDMDYYYHFDLTIKEVVGNIYENSELLE